MNKYLFVLLSLFFFLKSNSQEIIENPKQSSFYKKYTLITKVELTEEATILYITSKRKEKDSITVPKRIYITGENSSKKHFVTKSEGILLDTKTALNENKELSYKLFFPPLSKSSHVINLEIESEPNGSWQGQPRRSITLAYRVEIRPITKDNYFSKLSLNDAFVKAKKENKNVLLFFTASWCGPCNWMKKYIHPDMEVSTLIKNNYVAVEINRDTKKGTQLAKKYNNKGIPQYVLLTPDDKLLKERTGSCKKDEFIEFLTLSDSIKPKTLEKPVSKPLALIMGFGLRLGMVNNNFSNSNFNSRAGFTGDIFTYLSHPDDFYILRSGLGFYSKGVENFSINYLKVTPLEFGLKILDGALINTSGGIRANIAPYYALRLNKNNLGLQNNDYGARFGLSHYVGGTGSSNTNSIELELYYEYGVQDIFKNVAGRQNNKGFGLSLSLTF